MRNLKENDEGFEVWCDDTAFANPIEMPSLTLEQKRREEEFLNKPLPRNDANNKKIA